MKVFILYASAGAGHRKAAEAIYNYLKNTRLDLHLRLIDILDYSNPGFKFLCSSGYIFLIKRLPWLWYLLYRSSSFFYDNKVRIFSECLNCFGFFSLLRKENPDIIISTHFFTSSVVTIGKKQGWLKSKLITIVTDYVLHPFWIGEGVDTYIVSSDIVKEELVKKGVADNKIKTYGIPVDYKFYLPSDRNVLADKLKVAPSDFTALIITGTIGIGPIEDMVRHLASEAQLLVVCGSNEKLYDRLNKLNLKSVKLYHLIDNVCELMSVSDIVLTKAGGLTITESLIKRLPMIFFSSIPGLETANADIVCRYGCGFKANTVQKIRDIMLYLKNNPSGYLQVQENLESLRKPESLTNISSLIPST